MDLNKLNETDVREYFAMPILKAPGYSKGSNNDILREQELKIRYPHPFLGRKKPGRDPVLRGRPDYVLSVLGVCRWVLEIKAPSEALDVDAIEQSITYARHPEVSGTLVALMNGREFILFRSSQMATDKPVLRIETCELGALVEKLSNILTPKALRRDARMHHIDVERSLGGELRSVEEICGGLVRYDMATTAVIECPVSVREQLELELAEIPKKFVGLQFSVDHGKIWRGQGGVPVANIVWNSPYAQLQGFFDDKKLNEINYVCLSEEISENSAEPSTFDYFATVDLHQGEALYDMMKNDTVTMDMPAVTTLRGQATGYVDRKFFKGHFQTETDIEIVTPEFRIESSFLAAGIFEIHFS